jgi:REP element-mobilizing transposase RayT
MARRLRLHVPGGFYHVTLRGNHQQPIFFSRLDRDLLDGIVAEVVDRSGLRIHAYCWMTNHLHLLMQVAEEPLGRAILRIASRYARKVQARLETTGHLFERRYHCTIVDADQYLLTLLRYIHLNPVKAGLACDPLDYQWSSHRNYLGLAGQNWVTTDFALNMLGATRSRAIAAYCKMMGSACETEWGSGEPPLNAKFKDVLGDDDFAARVTGFRWQLRPRPTLDVLISDCCRRFAVTEVQLASRSKIHPLIVARAWLTHEAIAQRIASVSAVARRLDRSEGALRQLIMRYPRDQERDD